MKTLLALIAGVPFLFGAGELSNRRAPGFSLPDANARQHDPQDYRGQVVLIEFMKTNCPNCKAVSINLERVKQKYGGKVTVISVVTPPDMLKDVVEYARVNKLTSPLLFDCGQVTASYLKATPQKPTVHLPHLFLVDAEGMIRNDFSHGEQTKKIMEGPGIDAEIDKLLAASKAPAPKAAAPKK